MPASPVVIVGGGPVGLTTSLLLSRLGVSSILLERRVGTNPLPRARGMNCRTSEIWRVLGLSDVMRDISLPAEWTRSILYLTRLAGEEIGRMDSTSMWREATAVYSPAPFLCSSQDRIDALLEAEAGAQPSADVRFGQEVVGVRQYGDRVSVEALDVRTGRRSEIEAEWVIAADGANSFVRTHLGVALIGQRSNRWYLNVHFRADLSRYTAGDRKGTLLWTLDSEHEAVFQPLDGVTDWGCGVNFDISQVDPSAFDEHRVMALIKDMIDEPAPDIDIDVIAFRPWFVSSTVAQHYRVGQVIFTGDAVHQIPPFGGQGMNTGIADAHNLAWKLAGVIMGGAEQSLLDSYEQERREVAERICAFGRRNVGHVTDIRAGQSDRHVQVAKEYGNWAGIDVGAHYNSGALLPDGTPLPATEDSVVSYEPHARPGWRLPHRWLLMSRGGRRSTIDLFFDHFVLLTGPEGVGWDEAAGVEVLREGRDFAVEADPPLHEFLAVEADGALLVRPDGHVAARWTGSPENAADTVRAALTTIGIRVPASAGAGA